MSCELQLVLLLLDLSCASHTLLPWCNLHDEGKISPSCPVFTEFIFETDDCWYWHIGAHRLERQLPEDYIAGQERRNKSYLASDLSLVNMLWKDTQIRLGVQDRESARVAQTVITGFWGKSFGVISSLDINIVVLKVLSGYKNYRFQKISQ